MEKITIKIPRKGKVEYETNGFAGAECLNFAGKFLEKLRSFVGTVDVHKTEYTSEMTNVQQEQDVDQSSSN